jgi:leucine dehydrogenase
LNQWTIPNLHVAVVAGAANNQLASERDGEALLARNILYAPDFVINAGGIISVGCEYLGGYSEQDVARRVAEIGPRLQDLFSRASQAGVSPGRVAVEEAERRVVGAQSNGTGVRQGYCSPVVAERAHA